MNKDTIEKLTKLRLPGMLRAYKEQSNMSGINELTFEQRLTLMVDAEVDSRHNHQIERLIKNAQLSDKGASIEETLSNNWQPTSTLMKEETSLSSEQQEPGKVI